jgi:hypothetical protein
MTLDEFRATLANKAPPEVLTTALKGLWWDAKGDWAEAHRCAQEQDDEIGAAVHAYLHRKEGDLSNAGGWYRRAGRTMPTGTLDSEWTDLTAELLAK